MGECEALAAQAWTRMGARGENQSIVFLGLHSVTTNQEGLDAAPGVTRSPLPQVLVHALTGQHGGLLLLSGAPRPTSVKLAR